MPKIVGILTFMRMINFILNRVENEKSFITSGSRLFGYPIGVLNIDYRETNRIDPEQTAPSIRSGFTVFYQAYLSKQ